MNRFLSKYATSEGKIWNDRVLDNPYLEMPAEFKPLVAYKLLFGLAEKDAEAGWRCLENASDDTIHFICGGLRDYLVRNKRYVQNKMLKYTVANIEKF